MSLAFVFPGQGAQVVGMGRDLYNKYDLAKKRFHEADEALGYSIKDMCFEGPSESLQLTANTQPAILTVSVIAGELLMGEGIKPAVAGGHSLGEYSALVIAGVMDFATTVNFVHKRGAYMQEAVPVGEGAMAAILGADDELLFEVCEEASKVGVVQAVNFNCPGQTVIAGTTLGTQRAVELLKERGVKKAVLLPVSAPFHSSLMEPAARDLEREIEKIELHDAAFPVASNYTGKLQTKVSEIKKNLVKQADNPVKWIDCVQAMKEFGATTFVEAGPGKTLAGFNKRIDKSLTSYNVEDVTSLETVLATLKG